MLTERWAFLFVMAVYRLARRLGAVLLLGLFLLQLIVSLRALYGW